MQHPSKNFFRTCDEMFDSIATYFGNIFTALVLIFTDSYTALPTIKVNSPLRRQRKTLLLF